MWGSGLQAELPDIWDSWEEPPHLVSLVLVGFLEVKSHISKQRQSVSFGIFFTLFLLGCQPFHFSPAKSSLFISFGVFFFFNPFLERQYFNQEKMVTRAVPRGQLLLSSCHWAFPPKSVSVTLRQPQSPGADAWGWHQPSGSGPEAAPDPEVSSSRAGGCLLSAMLVIVLV